MALGAEFPIVIARAVTGAAEAVIGTVTMTSAIMRTLEIIFFMCVFIISS